MLEITIGLLFLGAGLLMWVRPGIVDFLMEYAEKCVARWALSRKDSAVDERYEMSVPVIRKFMPIMPFIVGSVVAFGGVRGLL